MNRLRENTPGIVGSLLRNLTVVCIGLVAWFGSVSQSHAQTAGFTVYGGPQSVALTAGTSEVLDVVVTPISGSGFTGNVSVVLSGLPAGLTRTPAASVADPLIVTPGVVSQIKIAAPAAQTSSVNKLTLTGTATTAIGYATEIGQVELTTTATAAGDSLPTDYVVTTSAAALSLVTSAITSQAFTVTVAAANSNGFTPAISGAIIGLPANVTASPASFTPTLGSPTTITITAAAGASVGNTVFTVRTISGTITHSMPVVLNVGTQAQGFLLSTPTALSVATDGTAVASIGVSPINGFNGKVTLSVGTLPTGVTSAVLSPTTIWPNSLTPDPNHPYASLVTLTVTGGTFTGTTNTSFTVTGTASGATTQTNTILLTTSNNVTNIVHATVATSPSPSAVPFPNQFIGFSISETPFNAFTGSGASTNPNFAQLLENFGPYVGLPLIRTQLENNYSNVSELESGTTYGSDKLKFFFVESPTFDLATDQTEESTTSGNIGSGQVTGVELDNEPDGYPSSDPSGIPGIVRPPSWTFADYLNEAASYQNYPLTGPYIAPAMAGSYWMPGIPALATALGTGPGGITQFTSHLYSGCLSPALTLLDEYSHNYYFDRYAGLVDTLPGSVPVRAGEMNTAECTTYPAGPKTCPATYPVGNMAAGDSFAASLWLIDTGFELNAAGAQGFNLHSQGTVNCPAFYDIAAVDGSGNITVRPPYYGAWFFAHAIQNGATPLPVTVTQMSGNVKVWATIDVSGNIRVMVLEKDADTTYTKTVSLNLGSYSQTAQVLQLSSSTGVTGNETGISLGANGATFNGTTDGILSAAPTTTNLNPTLTGGDYIYTIVVPDGTATLLKIPKNP